MYIVKFFILSILIFSSGTVKARDLEVKDRFFTYTISVEEDFIRFKTANSNVSIEKRKCSAHIVDRFRKQFDRYMKDPLAQVQRKNSLQVKLDMTAGYVHQTGDRAKFLKSMPNQIKQMKIEEGLNCNPT